MIQERGGSGKKEKRRLDISILCAHPNAFTVENDRELMNRLRSSRTEFGSVISISELAERHLNRLVHRFFPPGVEGFEFKHHAGTARFTWNQQHIRPPVSRLPVGTDHVMRFHVDKQVEDETVIKFFWL